MIAALNETSPRGSQVNDRVLTPAYQRDLACVYEVDPLRDRRWQSLIDRHPRASIFHSVGWLDALRRTYRYEPVVFTTSSPASDLDNGMLFCSIRSWITGKRIVSLPFSDYCSPLCDPGEEFDSLISRLRTPEICRQWKYLEVRPADEGFGDTLRKLRFKSGARYVLHRVDLEPAAEEIFRRFDKDSVQRRVRHAERVGVVEVCGKSDELLRDFYQLMVRTRARHNLPPQPYAWFKNLLESMGQAADLRLAYMKDVPVAGVLVLHFKDTSYYKHGCSDERFHRLGAMPFLLWRAILNAKSIGSETFDLGRTGSDDHGLIVFKNHWAPMAKSLTYWTYPSDLSFTFIKDWKLEMVKRICACMPGRVLALAGSLLYRHIG